MTINKIEKQEISAEIELPASKSISNRALILNFLSKRKVNLKNLSTAQDTKLLLQVLQTYENSKKKNFVFNLENAGTAFRFLTAVFSVSEGNFILTGNQRMKQRPIGDLAEALKMLGAEIYYLEKKFFPPIKILGKKIEKNFVEIDASKSSQFVSALILIAPFLKNGLKINIKNATSKTYIKMSLKLLEDFGFNFRADKDLKFIEIFSQQAAKIENYTIENDWSSAGYWYSMLSLFKKGQLKLKNLNLQSIQGDSKIKNLLSNVIESYQKDNDLIIRKKLPTSPLPENINFTDIPDLAPTLIALYCAMKKNFKFYGIKNLKIKESDRIAALKENLKQVNGILKNIDTDIVYGFCNKLKINKLFKIKTFEDHRIAMSLSIFAKLTNIEIDNPQVVEKSYPNFWKEFFKIID